MAMTQEPASTLAESVKSDIQSVATTSESTLNLLRALLGLENPLNTKIAPEVKKAVNAPARTTVKAPVRKITTAKLKSKDVFTIHHASDSQTSLLPLDHRRCLATEAFNTTLKHLNEGLKVKQTGALAREGQPPKRAHASPENALQTRSPNRRPLGPTNGKTLKTATEVLGGKPELEITADCAIAALQCLDDLSQGSSSSSEKPDLSLIRGSQILLEKILGLGLGKQAVRQVWQLRRQLTVPLRELEGSAKNKGQRVVKKSSTTSGRCLAEALIFNDVPEDAEILKLVSAFQVQVLKAGLLSGSSSIDQGLAELLQPSTPFSPTALIMRLLDMKVMTHEKAGQQLHITSQILSKICSNLRNQSSKSQSLSTNTTKLTIIMLEIRCRCWKLLGHKPDLERELWAPLGRTIQDYTEAEGQKQPENFQELMGATLKLRDISCAAGPLERLPISISNLLVELAQRCGSGTIALTLLEEQDRSDQSPSRLVDVIRHCKIATLHLSMRSMGVTGRLGASERALESLKKSVKGTASELKELLLYGARLRKAAAAVAVEIEESIHSRNVGQEDISLQTCAISLTYAVQRFSLRYLGQMSTGQNDTGATQRIPGDESAISRSAGHTVDAVLLVAKCSTVRLPMLWPDTEAALKESVDLARLLVTVNTSALDKNAKGTMAPSTCLKVSNLYWGWYLQGKESGRKPRELCSLLENSAEALFDCPDTQHRQSFYVVKHDRLSSLYIETRSYEKAQQTLRRAINSTIRQGALDEALEIASVKPSSFAWSDPKLDAHLLGSCLRRFARNVLNLEVTLTDPSPFYDDDTLPNLHRTQILERQLLALSDQPLPNAIRHHLVAMAETILSLCQQSESLVYRLRFIRDILSIAVKNPQFPVQDFLGDKLVQRACSCDHHYIADSCLLASYGPLLRSSVKLQWGFLNTRPSPEWLQHIISEINSEISQCNNASRFASAVDDPELLLQQLQAVADYAGMLDLLSLRLGVLELMRKVFLHCCTREPQRIATCLTHIATLQARLGNTAAAGRAFAEVENLIAKVQNNAEVRLVHGLSYAEYLNDLTNNAKSIKILTTSFAIYEEAINLENESESGRSRFKQESHLAHANLTAAALSFRQGDLASAIKYARRSVKLTTGLWAALEKLCEGFRGHQEVAGNESSMHATTEETTNTTLSIDHSNIQSMNKGAFFWSHVSLHFRALLRMSSLSAHCGLHQDSIHYAEQAMKLSKTIACESRNALAQTTLAVLYARSGLRAESRKKLLSLRVPDLDRLPMTEVCEMSLDLATVTIALEDFVQAENYLLNAESSISSLTSIQASPPIAGKGPPVSLEKQMDQLTIQETKTQRGAKTTSAFTKTKTAVASKARAAKQTNIPASPQKFPIGESVSPSTRRLNERLAVSRIQLQIRSRNPSTNVLDMIAVQFPESTITNTTKSFMDATLLLMQAMALFDSDAIHCVLAETALAFPSKYASHRQSGRVSVLSATTVSKKAKKRIAPMAKAVKGPAEANATTMSVPQDLLSKAYHLLSASTTTNTNLTASDLVHDMQKLFNRLSILSNAIGVPINYSAAKLIRDSLSPKDAMLNRERFMIETERATSDRTALYRWPLLPASELSARNDAALLGAIESINFNDLPDSWSVVSISLSDDRNEFALARIVAGQSPFLLRIPLCRTAIEDADDGEFGFDNAKEELIDITTKASLTAHDSRSQADKQARKAWWSEREALDERLQALLTNMENIWLGGFRGILSQQQRSDPNLISRFSSSLSTSLDNHLPSRQKTGNSTAKKNVQLHAHVLDLFIALGHPDHNELDDAITDLLYFVVDIHQFEGERNAYDEIDFDAILVDILDALRSYHGASNGDFSQHTILILDKELHAFPWESLPCLLNKSVSRMPSLSFIRERLAKIHAQSPTAAAYTIPATDGAYILNPGSDLPATESAFSDVFATQLPTFTPSSITGRRPTESEFETLLHSKSLLLYFGHGSGAQYIRGRRIKQLDQCAVTFLMGCSSGKMTECGVYESYGVPWNYMHGGAMAVVGTLWDVTDRDIDRFAGRVLGEWGLLEGMDEEGKGDEKARKMMKKMGRKNGNGKGKEKERKGKVALDEAVARAKDACILKYLNGASVVIYGLPTVLG